MRTFVKVGVGVAALGVLVWLFVSTLQDTIAEPYDIGSTAFSGWTLVSRAPRPGDLAVLGLRPPQPLTPALFDELFARTMASLTTPGTPMLPIVLAREVQGELGIVLPPDEMLTVARAAGHPSRPMCSRMRAMTPGSVIAAMTCSSPPPLGHRLKSMANTRCNRSWLSSPSLLRSSR